MMATLVKRLTFRGFIVSDFAAQLPQFLADMSAWLKEGRIKYREDVTAGLENAPPRADRTAQRRELRQEDNPGRPGAGGTLARPNPLPPPCGPHTARLGGFRPP